MNVLLIEDDIQLNTTIEYFLKFKKYEVASLLDGEKGIEYIDNNKYDLYIIDINLPNINGLDLIKYIRNTDLSTPIIIITASLEIDNLKIAYKNGCNEYMKKPFYLDELEIRINNLFNQQSQETISLAPNILYDLEYEELTIEGKSVKIRKKERRLLTLLIQNTNRTVPYEVIENYVWENEIKDIYPLRQLVVEIKKKLKAHSHILQADRGKGYKILQEKS